MQYLKILIAIYWILFWLYWIVSAFKSKRSIRPAHTIAFFGPRLWAIVLAAVLTVGFDHLPEPFRNRALGTSSIAEVAGTILFLFGMGIAVWARVNLGQNWGMPMTEKQHPELVTSGVYHYIRHPIYTGGLAMALGSAITVNAYWLLIFIVAVVYAAYSSFVEERYLSRVFGRTYEQYKDATKMFIPFLF